MAERMDKKSVAYLDLETARATLEETGGAFVQLGGKVAALARAYGRLLSATVYGDLSTEEARELKREGLERHLTTEEGEGSSPESIAIALDAGVALGQGVHAETVVLLSDDPQLSDLVRRWRRRGSYVVVVVPQAFVDREPAKAADRSVTVESLLARPVEAEAPPEPVRHEVRTRVAVAPLDLETYDWTRLVLLMRDLEAKMPFVGMRWLKNKVLGPHNVGVVGIADKQALLNRAVDNGFIETYRVGNRDEQGEPVTACKLVRENEAVKAVLAANPLPPPVAPGAAPGEAPPADTAEEVR